MLRPIVLSPLIATCAPEPGTQTGILPADLVLLDGRIVTVDDRFRSPRRSPSATAGSSRSDRTKTCARHIGSATRVIEGRGRTVIPGLIDTHVHALDVAAAEADAAIPEPAIDRCTAGLDPRRDRTAATGGLDLDAAGVSDAAARTRFPTRQELDVAAPHHPVVVDSAYAFSLNSAALRSSRHHARRARPARRSDREGCRRRTDGSLAERRRPVGPLPLGVGPGARRLEMLERVHQQYLAPASRASSNAALRSRDFRPTRR